MCGIAGVWGPGGQGYTGAVERMCAQMEPRGPDDGGVAMFGDDRHGGVFGARRLAIIDPSPAGHQPFVDEARGNAIVFNGMIYNYRELRQELEGLGERFSSKCDTEVILKAFGRFGPGCVERLNGMFAFAIWSADTASLFMARDRQGIKPLYYALIGDLLVFGSQVKTILASNVVPPSVSAAGVESFLSFGAVSDPLTIIDGVSALEAGHCATWSDGELDVSRYWSPDEVATRQVVDTDELRARLEAAVDRHTLSDVPVGVFLSGGVDSSIVAALAARRGGVRTVSVAFEEGEYSEARFQQSVVKEIGCESTTVTLGAGELLAASPAVFDAMDQPSFDGFNTHTVATAASHAGLKVALSGLGADELFDGYGYVQRIRKLEAARRLPGPLRGAISWGASRIGEGSQGAKSRSWLRGDIPRGASYELLRRLFLPDEVSRLTTGTANAPSPALLDMNGDLWNQVCALDLGNYTRNVLLRDTDAMSMSVGLEVRVPYLSDDLVGWAMSTTGRKRAGKGKATLISAARDLIPPEVAIRRKQGFGLPIAEWMSGPLRGEIAETLNTPPERISHLLDAEAVRSVWQRFVGGSEPWLHPWALYVLCRWARDLAPSSAV